MKCDLEYDFHDLEKMPKHVEMVRTKCQPKSWDGQNANHRNKSGQNANLWLALCPVGILSGWHFVRTPENYQRESFVPASILGKRKLKTNLTFLNLSDLKHWKYLKDSMHFISLHHS